MFKDLVVRLLGDSRDLQLKLGQGRDELGRFTQNVSVSVASVASSMAAMMIPVQALGAASLHTFAGFEQSLKQIEARGEPTAAEMERVKAAALDMGAKTKYSAGEAAAGMAELMAKGFDASKAVGAMPGILSLAASGNLAVARASEIASDALAQFGLKATDTGRVADVLAKAANLSSASVEDLGTALSYAGPPARAAGLSIEQTTAAIALMADAGIRGERAGTSLRGILVDLAKPSKEAQRTLDAMGVSITDAAGRMRPLADIVDDLRAKHMTLAQAASLVGVQGATGLLALADKGGEALRRVAGDLEHASGAADKMAAKMNEGLAGSLEKAKGSIETAGIVLGEALAPAMVRVAGHAEESANKAAGLIQQFNKLPEPVRDGTVALGALVATMPLVALAAAKVFGAVNEIRLGLSILPSAAAAAGAGLQAVPWVAIAGSIAYVTYAFLQMRDAEAALKQAQGDRMTTLAILEARLRAHGVEFDALSQKYRQGIISLKEYETALQGLARSHAPVAEGAKASATSHDAAKTAAAAAAAAMSSASSSAGHLTESYRPLSFETRSLANHFIVLRAAADRQQWDEQARRVAMLMDRMAKAGGQMQFTEQLTRELTAGLEQMGGAVTVFAAAPWSLVPKHNVDVLALGDSVRQLGKELQEASKHSLSVAMGVDPDAIVRRTVNSGAAKDIEREAIARGKAIETEAKKGAAAAKRASDEMHRHVERVMHSMARDLTNVIFQGGKFWDMMAGLGKRAAANAAQSILEAQLKRVTGLIGKIVADSGIASKALGALFGIGASAGVSAATSAAGSAAGSAAAGAAGSVAGGVAAAGGSAGSAAAGVASGASSGAAGIVGAVGAIGTMISSIVGNFQMAGMNKSLDLIEREVRYSQIHLLHTLENSNKWWPFMKDCHDRLRQIVDTGIGVYNATGDQGIRIAGAVAGGGVGSIIINNPVFNGNTAKEMADDLMSEVMKRMQASHGL